MLKHIREALKRFKAMRPNIQIEIDRMRVHVILRITLEDGRVRTLAVAGSPKDSDISTKRTINELLRITDEPPENTYGKTHARTRTRRAHAAPRSKQRG